MTARRGAAWTRCLSWLLPARYRDEVLADLLEERATRTALGTPALLSAWWLAGHILRSAWTSRRIERGPTAAAWWDGLRVDLSQTTRALAHAKGFTAVAVITFALGMGVNIAVFSLFDTLLFRPLPFADAERLVQIHAHVFKGELAASTYEVNYALRDEAMSLDGLAWAEPYKTDSAPVPGESPLVLTAVTANMLDVLGVHPVRGRGFEEADAIVGDGDTSVILTHDTWRSRFGGRDDVLTQTWGHDQRYRVIGVLPEGFLLPSSLLVEHRDGLLVKRWNSPRNGLITVAPVARLKENVSVEAAQAELDIITERHDWARQGDESIRLRVQPLRSGFSTTVGPYLWLTSSAVWLVLAVACVNLSTLMLMRGRSRQRLGALRAALGASPARLVRLSLVEAAVLCVAGGGVGWLLYFWTGNWIASVLPATLRGFAVAPTDVRVVAMSLAAIAASAALTGVLPALAAKRVDILTVLRGATSGPTRRTPLTAGRVFLALQAAFGAVVVVGAAVAVPAFAQYVIAPHGFVARDLYSVDLGRDSDDGMNNNARGERLRAVVEIIAAVPQVEQVSASLVPPYQRRDADVPWTIGDTTGTTWAIGGRMFETLGTPMRAGREFAESDITAGSTVAVINEASARALWPGVPIAAILGRPIETIAGPKTVIGVASDIRMLPSNATVPGVFLPVTTTQMKALGFKVPIAVRMRAGAVPDLELLRTRLRERFPELRVSLVSTGEQLGAVLDRPRFLAVLFGVLAGVALLLAATGVYAVAAFESVTRRHEMAIRQALGATAARLRGRLGADILAPVLVGTAMGLSASWLGARTFQAQVAELETVSLTVYLAALLLIVGATVIALWRPARQMARVDPATELRKS